MDGSAWLGLLLGLAIGVIYGLWQAWDMRGGPGAPPTIGSLARAAFRMVFLMGALLAALRLTSADKVWLVGGTALGFSLVFVVRLKRILAKKK